MKTFRYSLPAVCLLALALPNLAAARPSTLPNPLPEPCPVAHIVLNVSYTCAAEFTLPASNGYKVTVSGDPAGSGPGDIELSAERGGETTTYIAPQTLTPAGTIRASFGRLGKLSLHFRPSGKVRRVRVPKTCLRERPPTVTAKLGTFIGSFRFRGEGGYTKVSAHRMQGGVGDPLAIGGGKLQCESPHSPAKEKQELAEVVLSASAPHAGIAFTAAHDPGQLSQLASPTGAGIPNPGILFLLLAAEKAEGMSIIRLLAAVGPSGDLLFDNALTSATVTPPPPFTGTASFRRGADGSVSWTGSLSAPLPGLGTVRLTEPRFKAELATLATSERHSEEEAKRH